MQGRAAVGKVMSTRTMLNISGNSYVCKNLFSPKILKKFLFKNFCDCILFATILSICDHPSESQHSLHLVVFQEISF